MKVKTKTPIVLPGWNVPEVDAANQMPVSQLSMVLLIILVLIKLIILVLIKVIILVLNKVGICDKQGLFSRFVFF